MTKPWILITLGASLLAVSVGWWALSRSPEETGNVGAIEEALTSTTLTTEAPVTSTTTTLAPVTPQPQPPAPTAPPLQFTVSEELRSYERVPAALRISAISVDAPIYPAGVTAGGEMEVPDNANEIGWYKYGPAPGEAGSAVLAAHVDLAGQGPGVFFDLRKLEPGSLIEVEFDDGLTQSYRAVGRTIYGKDELPTEAIFSREGPAVLTLITCGGGFNREIRRYDSNVVVYAVPVDGWTPDPS